MRNRPAIFLVLLALVALAAVQFFAAVAEDDRQNAPVVMTEPVEERSVSPSEPELNPEYGGLTEEEFYALQDAEDEAAEERERLAETISAEELERLEDTDVLLEGDAPELTAEEEAAQAAVEEIFNRQDAEADETDAGAEDAESE